MPEEVGKLWKGFLPPKTEHRQMFQLTSDDVVGPSGEGAIDDEDEDEEDDEDEDHNDNDDDDQVGDEDVSMSSRPDSPR